MNYTHEQENILQIEYDKLSHDARHQLDTLPTDLRQQYNRFVLLIESDGYKQVMGSALHTSNKKTDIKTRILHAQIAKRDMEMVGLEGCVNKDLDEIYFVAKTTFEQEKRN